MTFVYRDRGSAVMLTVLVLVGSGLLLGRAVLRDLASVEALNLVSIPHVAVLIGASLISLGSIAAGVRSLCARLVLTDEGLRVRGVFRSHRVSKERVRGAQARKSGVSALLWGASIEISCAPEEDNFAFRLPGRFATLDGAEELARKIRSWVTSWGIEEDVGSVG